MNFTHREINTKRIEHEFFHIANLLLFNIGLLNQIKWSEFVKSFIYIFHINKFLQNKCFNYYKLMKLSDLI